jgi:oligopeptide/dipeptide ABC transporter ATP-binding protein
VGAAICELKGVSKYYYARSGLFDTRVRVISALHGIELSLRQGEILGLVGESGCGKSTLARIALGLEPPSGGQVFFSGKDIARHDRLARQAFRRQAQMVFQDPFSSLNPKKTVFQILSEPLRIHGICARGRYRQQVAGLLKEVGLDAQAMDRYPHEFSGGQRQRIGLARALATRPGLLVADEPTSALDVSIQAQIINLLLDLHERLGLSYLFISHDLPVIQFVSDRVAVMYRGRLMELMPRRAFLREGAGTGATLSHHPYTRLLLDAVPVPDPRRGLKAGRHMSGFGEPSLGGTLDAGRPESLSGCVFADRCDQAMEKCLVEEPAWIEVGTNHFVACFRSEHK